MIKTSMSIWSDSQFDIHGDCFFHGFVWVFLLCILCCMRMIIDCVPKLVCLSEKKGKEQHGALNRRLVNCLKASQCS